MAYLTGANAHLGRGSVPHHRAEALEGVRRRRAGRRWVPCVTSGLPLQLRGKQPVSKGLAISRRVWCRWRASLARSSPPLARAGRPAQKPHPVDPFDTGCLPLDYSGNPGVNGVSDRGDIMDSHSSLSDTHPVDTGCLPLSYSGDPGVNGVSHRGVSSGRFARVVVRNAGHILPADEPSVAFDMIDRFITGRGWGNGDEGKPEL